jgi:hypothetical protein
MIKKTKFINLLLMYSLFTSVNFNVTFAEEALQDEEEGSLEKVIQENSSSSTTFVNNTISGGDSIYSNVTSASENNISFASSDVFVQKSVFTKGTELDVLIEGKYTKLSIADKDIFDVASFLNALEASRGLITDLNINNNETTKNSLIAELDEKVKSANNMYMGTGHEFFTNLGTLRADINEIIETNNKEGAYELLWNDVNTTVDDFVKHDFVFPDLISKNIYDSISDKNYFGGITSNITKKDDITTGSIDNIIG